VKRDGHDNLRSFLEYLSPFGLFGSLMWRNFIPEEGLL
jgi:hypothetical protein